MLKIKKLCFLLILILIRGKTPIISHSKVRKRYNICLKDGLPEECAQSSGLKGFSVELTVVLWQYYYITCRFKRTQHCVWNQCRRWSSVEVFFHSYLQCCLDRSMQLSKISCPNYRENTARNILILEVALYPSTQPIL